MQHLQSPRVYHSGIGLTSYRANLQYNMAEDDRIVAQMGNRIGLLEESLKSHRTAMALNVENTDVAFNTAQVLTSLAEAVLESETQQVARVPTRGLLEEAVELFTKCLASQQRAYEQMRIEIAKAQEEQADQEREIFQQEVPGDGKVGDDMDMSSTASSAGGEWATVEEPLTPGTILETCTAQLGALTTLLGLYEPTDLANIEPRTRLGLGTANEYIPTLINLLGDSPFQRIEEKPSGPTLSIASPTTTEPLTTTPKDDALLAVAHFQATLAELAYRNNQTTATQYLESIQSLFSALSPSDQSSSPTAASLNTRSAAADALLDVASAIADSPNPDLDTWWNALANAQQLLTALSTGPSAALLPAARLADAFMARGDADLFRFRITLLEGANAAWANSRTKLVSNAGVFYRGARAYAEKAEKRELRETADTKALIAEVLKEVVEGGASIVAKAEWRARAKGVAKGLEQMVEEGVLGREEAEGVLKILST